MTSPIQNLPRSKLSLFKPEAPEARKAALLSSGVSGQAQAETPTALRPLASVAQQAEVRQSHTQDAASLYRQMGLSAELDSKTKTLTLTGSPEEDQISVTAKSRRNFQVSMNGVTQDFKDVESLRIHGKGAADFVNIDKSVTIPAEIHGGEGTDILYGGGGNNEIHGDGDADIIRGGPKQNKLFGGDGVDHIDTQGTSNEINGGQGRDYINNEIEAVLRIDASDNGDNIHIYPAGDEAVRVNVNGEDTIHENVKRIEVNGGNGDDTVLFDPGVNIPARIRGGEGEDIMEGGDASNTILGGRDDDILFGGPEKDNLFGSTGADLIFGKGGADTILGGKDDDIIDGGEGNDVINAGSGDDVVNGNGGNDIIALGSGDDKGFGNTGNDKINGGRGKNELDGGAGTNKIKSTGQDQITSGLKDSVFTKAAMLPIVRSAFAKWDSNANGSLSETELDTAMSSSSATGDEAAALASIKSRVFGVEEAPDSVSQFELEFPRPGRLFDGTLNQARSKIWNGDSKLFGKDGPQLGDIQQGGIGDCAWLGALSSKVYTDPDSVRNMIKDRGDGTFDIKFAGHDTVNVQAPTDAQKGYGVKSAKGQWVSVLERGYNKIRAHELDRPKNAQIRGHDGVTAEAAIYTQTGHTSTTDTHKDLQQTRTRLNDALANGRVVLTARYKGKHPGIVTKHAYTVLGFDPAKDTITVRNPWGRHEPTAPSGKAKDGTNDGVFELTVKQFSEAFSGTTFEDGE